MRKALGGGWRKSGPLAAAVFAALEDAPARMKKDHEHAKRFASGDSVKCVFICLESMMPGS